MREHEARHAIGERRLADAGRAADQPGMRHAAARDRHRAARCSASAWPNSDGGLARHAGRRLVLVARSRRGVLDRDRRGRRMQPLARPRSRCARRPRRAARGVDQRRSAWARAAREREIGVAQLLVKFDRLRLEAVGRALAAPLACARARPTSAGTSRMKVRSGMSVADGDALEPADQLARRPCRARPDRRASNR